jgi:hypothetical protein
LALQADLKVFAASTTQLAIAGGLSAIPEVGRLRA